MVVALVAFTSPLSLIYAAQGGEPTEPRTYPMEVVPEGHGFACTTLPEGHRGGLLPCPPLDPPAPVGK